MFARKRVSHVLNPSSRKEAICILSMQNRCPRWFQKLPSCFTSVTARSFAALRIPLAVPALYLRKVTDPAELLSRSVQLLRSLSCLVLPRTAAFKLPPGCRCIYMERPDSSFPLLQPVSRGGNRSLLAGRRHKGSQNNSAAEKHRS